LFIDSLFSVFINFLCIFLFERMNFIFNI
jgi:hypothetical protein